MIFLIAFWIIVFVLWLGFMIRNNWVYRVRTDFIYADLEVYEGLPSYDTMMRQFWIWDASKFIGQGEADKRRALQKQQRKSQRGRDAIARASKQGI